MSTWAFGGVTCPRCQGTVETRQARSVSVPRAPAWRAALLDGSLHRPTCARCRAVLDVAAAFLYTDLTRGQWIAVEPPTALAAWAQLEADALATFARAAATAPILADVTARCQVRVVFGVDELRERVRAAAAGLDDAVLECAKLAALRREPALRGAGDRLRFEAFAEDALILVAAPGATPAQVRGRWRIPRALVADLDVPAWRREFPELFAPGFVSIDRWLAEAA